MNDKLPPLPEAAHTLPHVGEVTIRGLLLSQRLALTESDRDQHLFIQQLLAQSVYQDGAPLFDVAGWDQYGAAYPQDTLALFQAVMGLNHLNTEDAAKN